MVKIDRVMTNNSYDYARRELDCYWTESYCTQWLCDAGLKDLGAKYVTWEPCAGIGSMSHILKRNGHEVLSTDICDHGYADLDGTYDFLAVEEVADNVKLIITNPPYRIEGIVGAPDCEAVDFVEHAIKLMKPVNGSVAMLLRNEFDCASTRKHLFDKPPFAARLVLTKRPNWIAEKDRRPGQDAGPRHNYSWFVWNWRNDCDAATYYLPFDEGEVASALLEI